MCDVRLFAAAQRYAETKEGEVVMVGLLMLYEDRDYSKTLA